MVKATRRSRFIGSAALAAALSVFAPEAALAQYGPNSPQCVSTRRAIDRTRDEIANVPLQEPNLIVRKWRLDALGNQLAALVKSAEFICSPAPPPLTKVSLRPKYMVLTVLYAPPGTTGGGGTSYVEYAHGSATGSKISASKSFKDEESITASVKVGGPFNSLEASVGTGWSESEASKNEVEVKKRDTNSIKVAAPGADGINHDQDRIFLWLNPQVNLEVGGKFVNYWLVLPRGEVMDVQYVYVREMKHPETLAKRVPDLANRLTKQLGFTAEDYAQILASDPFGNGSTTIDANRFLLTPTTFPYEPPLNPTDGPTIQTYTLTNDLAVTNAQARESSTDIHTSITGSAGAEGIATVTLKYEGKWTWTHGNSTETSAGSSESATAAVGDPSYGYSGPNDIAVYWDTIFHSFMFAPFEGQPFAIGRVTDATNKGVQGQEVLLSIPGRKMRTFTNKRGEYRFFGLAQRSTPLLGQIQVGAIRRAITIGPSAARSDFQLH